jgi:O-antigen ligase
MAKTQPDTFSLAVAGVVLLIPTYLIRLTILDVPTNFFEVVLGLIFAWGLFSVVVRRRLWQAAISLPRAILFWTAFFLLAAGISTVVSDVLRVSLGILKGWIIVPILLAWLVLAAQHLSNNKSLLADSLILSGLITALFSLSFYVPGERLSGIYDGPNSLALWLAPLIVLAGGCSWSSHARGGGGFYLGAAMIMLIALILTQSVVGVAVVSGMISLIIFLRINRLNLKRYLLYGIGIGVAVAFFLWSSGRGQYFLQPGNSFTVRQQLWSVSAELIREQPLFGVGLGQFEPAYQQVLHQRFAAGEEPLREFVYRDPHNWVFALWLNLGLLGLVSFAALHFLALRRALRSPVGMALLTLLLFGLVDTIYWKNDLAALHWMLLALLYGGSMPVIRRLSPVAPPAAP